MTAQHRTARLAGAVSLACCALLLLTVGVMTAVSGAFLQQQNWSPVKRTPTEWPSLLALAPGGWTVSAAFALAGSSAFVLAFAFKEMGCRSSAGVAYGLFTAGLGLVGVAFPADLPGAARSWHGFVHNAMYNLIPIGLGLSMLVKAALGDSVTGWRPTRAVSAFGLGLLGAFVLLTLVDSIAQLARYGVLATMLGWVVLLAIESVRFPQATWTPDPVNPDSSKRL